MTWIFYALIAALLSSLAALFEKRELNRLHSIDFSASIAFMAALLTFPVLFSASWESISPQILFFMFVLSFFAAWGFLNVTRGVRHMEISLSSPLFLLGPLITTFLAFLILREHISSLQIMGMLILLLGAYALETTHLFHGREFWQNIWGNKYSRQIIFGLTLYGLTSVGDRIILAHWGVPVTLYTAIIQLFIAIQFLFLTWRFRGSPAASMVLVQKYWVSILVVALLTVGYRIAQGYATTIATSIGLVIAIKRSSTLFTTIIGGGLFHDHNVWRKALACAIMIAGVACITIR